MISAPLPSGRPVALPLVNPRTTLSRISQPVKFSTASPVLETQNTQVASLEQLRWALTSAQPSLLFGAQKPKGTSSEPSDFQPILAVKVELDQLKYPVIISPKIDGNRGLVRNGQVLGRSLLPIPNTQVQKILARPELEGMDGELIASEPTDPLACRKATSFLRSKNKPGEFAFWVFDLWNEADKPFEQRLRILKDRVNALPEDLRPYVKLVPQITVNSEAEILAHEKQWLQAGYEGAIIRKHDAPYLTTRSTMVDQAFMKLKRFFDSEAQIIGFRPLDPKSELAKSMIKDGELTPEQFSNMTEQNQALGGYRVRDLSSGAEFNLGTGQLTLRQRQTLWKNQKALEGKVVKYKYFPVGMTEEDKIPRHPTFLSFREAHDMPADLKAIADQLNNRSADNNNNEAA